MTVTKYELLLYIPFVLYCKLGFCLVGTLSVGVCNSCVTVRYSLYRCVLAFERPQSLCPAY
jgi:hypothetical protein